MTATDDTAPGEVAALQAEVASLRERAERAEKNLAWNRNWNGSRFARLSQWAHEEVEPLSARACLRFFDIVANGKPAPWRPAEAGPVSSEVASLRAELEEARRERDEWKGAAERRINDPIWDRLREIAGKTLEIVDAPALRSSKDVPPRAGMVVRYARCSDGTPTAGTSPVALDDACDFHEFSSLDEWRQWCDGCYDILSIPDAPAEAPTKCKDWCAGFTSPGTGYEFQCDINHESRYFCSPACRDAGRPVNPSKETGR
jgi:hypothetical protein